jgi:hypothetical protein
MGNKKHISLQVAVHGSLSIKSLCRAVHMLPIGTKVAKVHCPGSGRAPHQIFSYMRVFLMLLSANS